jgi:hypothetical protein
MNGPRIAAIAVVVVILCALGYIYAVTTHVSQAQASSVTARAHVVDQAMRQAENPSAR